MKGQTIDRDGHKYDSRREMNVPLDHVLHLLDHIRLRIFYEAWNNSKLQGGYVRSRNTHTRQIDKNEVGAFGCRYLHLDDGVAEFQHPMINSTVCKTPYLVPGFIHKGSRTKMGTEHRPLGTTDPELDRVFLREGRAEWPWCMSAAQRNAAGPGILGRQHSTLHRTPIEREDEHIEPRMRRGGRTACTFPHPEER